METSVCRRRQNGYEFYNPICVFLVSYKLIDLIMKILSGKLKYIYWNFVSVKL